MIPAVVAVTMAMSCPPAASPDDALTTGCAATAPQSPSPVLSLRTTPPPFAIPSIAPDPVAPAAPLPAAPTAPAATTAPAAVQAGGPVASEGAGDADEIVVTGKRRGSRAGDPVAAVNEVTFAATQAVDTAVVRPVAMSYAKVVPKPIRNGLRNFLFNLFEPVVFLNYLLQLKPGKAMETAGRFAVNSTVGVVGLFDFAKRKPFRLPRRPNGFANTLGYYGVKPGAFLFLPIVGPTTVRDLFGRTLDRLLLPVAVGDPFTRRELTLTTGIGGALDDRVENDARLAAERKASVDAYSANRDAYLAMRQAEIDHLLGRDTGKMVDPIERSPVRSGLPIP